MLNKSSDQQFSLSCVSDESFIRMEQLCTNSCRPLILLNGSPMSTSGLNSSKYSYQPSFPSQVSVLTHLNDASFNGSIPVPLYHTHNFNTSFICLFDNDTSSSGNFSSDSSDFICESHDDGYSFHMDCSMIESSGYSSCQYSNGSPYKIRDTLENCSYRTNQSLDKNLKEPETPIKYKSSAKKLDLQNDSLVLNSRCDLFNESTPSAFYRTKGISEMSSKFTDDSVNFSKRPQIIDESCRLRDSLDVCSFRRSLNECGVSAESSTSIDSPIIEPVTSSPFTTPKRNVDNDQNSIYTEPDNLKNTLERVNYRLRICGFKTPSPTRMIKRKRLMELFVADLLQQESSKTVKRAKPFYFKLPKRTISIDALAGDLSGIYRGNK